MASVLMFVRVEIGNWDKKRVKCRAIVSFVSLVYRIVLKRLSFSPTKRKIILLWEVRKIQMPVTAMKISHWQI